MEYCEKTERYLVNYKFCLNKWIYRNNVSSLCNCIQLSFLQNSILICVICANVLFNSLVGIIFPVYLLGGRNKNILNLCSEFLNTFFLILINFEDDLFHMCVSVNIFMLCYHSGRSKFLVVQII